MPTERIQDFTDARPITATGNAFVARVYNWMAVGLGVTAAVALVVANTPSLVQAIYGNRAILIVLLLAQIGVAVGVGAASRRASPALATALFVAYAAMLGLTLSFIFLVYTAASIGSTFLVAGGMFGAMSFYGWTTKRDLTSIGSFAVMALIGLILASVVNIFLQNNAMGWIISFAGVAIFVALTAYDTQKIRQIGSQVDADSSQGRGLAIQGALALYLDFVNLFLFLLRIFGRRR